MIEQAVDFRDESDVLHALLEGLGPKDWHEETQFKRWTFADVIAHLHVGNHLALHSLADRARYSALQHELLGAVMRGEGHLAFTRAWLGDLEGATLLAQWREFYNLAADRFAAADPHQRVPWAGAQMSVRSSITARLMETWAHGQALYDALGQVRRETDRIRNVAHLGVKTFGYCFANRGLPVPQATPHVRLEAPSGAVWEWGLSDAEDAVAGDAVEFCQVVTQVRNVADTNLRLRGPVAERWMSIAQCFAGPPEDPPPPGTRYRRAK